MKVTHIITDLGTGGAQVMLHELLRHMDKAGFDAEVVSLTDAGVFGEKIEQLGVPVWAIGMGGNAPNPGGLWRLASRLRRSQPDVVQTWLYHADLLGGLAAQLARVRAVAWGLHITHLDPRSIKRTTLWTAQACARLSHHLPRKIVCCAESSAQLHAGMGYAAEKMVVIPNGFDLERFKPDAAARSDIRRELGIAGTTPLIGLFARFHPQKDHENFVRAAAALHAHAPEAQFLLCGDGSDWQNLTLVKWIDEAGMRSRFHLVGRRQDVPRLYAALDIFSLSSACGEAFPMVVGEAMACGVPCVVTDVGDSALMVGETGRVVPPKDADALAAAWSELLAMNLEARQTLGVAARRRIKRRYDIASIAARYGELYRNIGSN